jgi:hypothetical protein
MYANEIDPSLSYDYLFHKEIAAYNAANPPRPSEIHCTLCDFMFAGLIASLGILYFAFAVVAVLNSDIESVNTACGHTLRIVFIVDMAWSFIGCGMVCLIYYVAFQEELNDKKDFQEALNERKDFSF